MPASSISRGRRFVAVAVATVLALAVAGPLPAYAEPTDPPSEGGLVAGSPQATLVASVVTDPIAVAADDPRPLGAAAAAGPDDVYIPDPALSQCLAELLGLDPATPYFDRTATADLYWFGCYAGNNQIQSLEGLDELVWTNLTSIDIVGHAFADISALARLDAPDLMAVALSYNKITDLSPLAQWDTPQLVYLDLSWNEITDIGPLTALTGLRSLWLNGNLITDVAPLADLPELGRFDEWGNESTIALYGNRITDFRPLAEVAGFTSGEAVLDLADQRLPYYLTPGEHVVVKAYDIDGTRLDLVAVDEYGSLIQYNPDSGVIRALQSGFYMFTFASDKINATGYVEITASRQSGYQGQIPDRPDFVNQADVFVLTLEGSDPQWLTDDRVGDILDGAMDWWSGQTGLVFGLEATIMRQVVTPDQCDPDIALNLARSAFGTTLADYAPDKNRNLIVIYDEGTCDVMPGTAGVAWQFSNDPLLGAGGTVTLRAVAEGGGYFGPNPEAALAHELGHVYGLGHTDSHICQNTNDFRLSWDERLYGQSSVFSCYMSYYGDSWSIMGMPDSSGTQHLTAFQRYWFGLELLGDTAEYLAEPGSYVVDLVPTSGDAGTQVLLVRSPDAAGYPDWEDEWAWANLVFDELVEGFVYSLEFRAADTELLDAGARPGVYISVVNPWSAGLVGETLLQPSGRYYTHEALHAGQVFTSVTGQVTVEVLSESAEGARVAINVTDGQVLSGSAELRSYTGVPDDPWTVTAVWDETPDTVTYQWLRDWEPIEGATGQDYLPSAPDDSGHLISVRLTASKAGWVTTSIESQGYWFDYDPITLPDEPVPADGFSVMDVVVELRDGLNRVVPNQPAQVFVLADAGGYAYIWIESTEDPDTPGRYHVPVSSVIPGDFGVYVYGADAYVSLPFAPTTDNQLRLWPSDMIRAFGYYSPLETAAALTLTDASGNPLDGVDCAFSSPDPDIVFQPSPGVTDEFGGCRALVAYSIEPADWTEEPGACRTVDVTVAAGGVSSTVPLRVCSPYDFDMFDTYGTAPADGVTQFYIYIWLQDPYGEMVAGQADVIQLETTGGAFTGPLVEMYPGIYMTGLVSDTPGDFTVTATWHDLTDSSTFTFTPPPANPFGQLTEFLHRLIQLIHDLVTGLQGLGR